MNTFYYPEHSAPTRGLWRAQRDPGRKDLKCKQPLCSEPVPWGSHTGFRPLLVVPKLGSHWMHARCFQARKPTCIPKETLKTSDSGLTLLAQKFWVQREQEGVQCMHVSRVEGEPERGASSPISPSGRSGSLSQKEPEGRRADALAVPPDCRMSPQPLRRDKKPSRGPARETCSLPAPLQPAHGSTSQIRSPNAPSKMREKAEAGPALRTCYGYTRVQS